MFTNVPVHHALQRIMTFCHHSTCTLKSLQLDLTCHITILNFCVIPQVSFLPAGQITEVAKTCVCPHLMDGSTAVAVETDNFWKTAPARVRKRNSTATSGLSFTKLCSCF